MKALGEYVSKISGRSCQIKATSINIPSLFAFNYPHHLVLDPFHDCSSCFLLNAEETSKQSNVKTILLVSTVSYKLAVTGMVQREENSSWQIWQIQKYKTGYWYYTITRSILVTDLFPFTNVVPTHVSHSSSPLAFSHPLYAMWLRLFILLLPGALFSPCF